MSEYDDKIAQGEREQAEDAAVLESITIPPHREGGTFTDRTITGHVVRTLKGQDLGLAGSLIIFVSAETANRLQEGDKIAIEWLGKRGGPGAMVMGIVHDGQWIQEQSDEDHEAWLNEIQEKAKRDEEQYLSEHLAEWDAWVAEFPEWLKTPAEALRRDMGATMVWGYQMVAFRLAVMYVEMGEEILGKTFFEVEYSEEISEFAKEVGTTGRQHSLGLSFAQRHLEETADA